MLLLCAVPLHVLGNSSLTALLGMPHPSEETAWLGLHLTQSCLTQVLGHSTEVMEQASGTRHHVPQQACLVTIVLAANVLSQPCSSTLQWSTRQLSRTTTWWLQTTLNSQQLAQGSVEQVLTSAHPVCRYYRRSYVELQRNDATTRSPVYAHFSETLTGVETVRAYGLQKRFTMKSDDQIDFNHR